MNFLRFIVWRKSLRMQQLNIKGFEETKVEQYEDEILFIINR